MNQFSDADFTVSHQFLSNLPDEENISFGIFLGDLCYSGNEIALIDMQKVYDLALEKLIHKKRVKVPIISIKMPKFRKTQ